MHAEDVGPQRDGGAQRRLRRGAARAADGDEAPAPRRPPATPNRRRVAGSAAPCQALRRGSGRFAGAPRLQTRPQQEPAGPPLGDQARRRARAGQHSRRRDQRALADVPAQRQTDPAPDRGRLRRAPLRVRRPDGSAEGLPARRASCASSATAAAACACSRAGAAGAAPAAAGQPAEPAAAGRRRHVREPADRAAAGRCGGRRARVGRRRESETMRADPDRHDRGAARPRQAAKAARARAPRPAAAAHRRKRRRRSRAATNAGPRQEGAGRRRRRQPKTTEEPRSAQIAEKNRLAVSGLRVDRYFSVSR